MSDPARRRAVRLRFRAQVQLFDGRNSVAAELVNLSEGGAFVAVEPPVTIGTGLSFWLPHQSGRMMLRGHVRWTRSLEAATGAPVGSGIEFHDPDGSCAAEIVALLDAATD